MSDHPLQTPIEVCLIMRHFHPILAGAAERFRRYSGRLAARGVCYRVFTLRESEFHAPNEEMENGLVVHRIEAAGTPWERDSVLFEAAAAYLREAPPAKRVLQTSLCHKLIRPWLIKIRELGVESVYVGTMVGQSDVLAPRWRRWKQSIRDWFNYRPFSRVVASTTVMERWQRSLGVRADRIRVIPNGVDVDRFRPVPEEQRSALRARLGLEPDGKMVLFAGSIVPRKGVELLLNAWSKMAGAGQPSPLLILAGGFDRPTFMTQERIDELSRFQQRMRDLAASPAMGDSVRFVGETSRIEDWMQAADAFVFPSEQEGMGNVVLEAMACGLPCLITRFHGMPEREFGRPGVEFELVERAESPLVEGLVTVLEDSVRIREMGVRARKWAETEAGYEVTIRAYEKLFRELVGEGAGLT